MVQTGCPGASSSLPDSERHSLQFNPHRMSHCTRGHPCGGLCLQAPPHPHPLCQLPKPLPKSMSRLPQGPSSSAARQAARPARRPLPSLTHSARSPRAALSLALPAGPSDLVLTQHPYSLPHGNPVVTLTTPTAPPVEIAGFLSVPRTPGEQTMASTSACCRRSSVSIFYNMTDGDTMYFDGHDMQNPELL